MIPKAIEILSQGPAIYSDHKCLGSLNKLSIDNRNRIKKIPGNSGPLMNVYYLDDENGIEEDRAVTKYVKVNFKKIREMDWDRNNLIYTIMPKDLAKKIRAEVRGTFK